MTTLTIILITWFISGLLSSVLIIITQKEDIIVDDIKYILLLLILGHIGLFLVLLILTYRNLKLLKIKLPKGDKVIWKYPKKN